MMKRVVVLGASPKSDRYSYKAIEALLNGGFDVVPVNPRGGVIQGISVATELRGVKLPIDTLTLYIGGDRVVEELEGILAVSPKRVIFNPGTENELAQKRLSQAGIEIVVGCTLVMLATNQF